MISLLVVSCRCTSSFVTRLTKSVAFKCGNFTILKPAIISTRSLSNTRKVNTNVPNDVVLYSYDGTIHIRILNVLAVAQLIFCNYFAGYLYKVLLNNHVNENDAERNNLPVYAKYGLVAGTLLIGYGFMSTAYLFSIRAIKFIILKKGGSYVSIITHSPIGKDGIITVPVKTVSSFQSRATAKIAIPIKIKDKFLFYLLDMNGKFKNSLLFDATVGLKRSFASK